MSFKEGMTMLTSQETMTNSDYRGSEAFIWPQKIWEAKLHEAEELVDKTFHFWHHVLVRQQEFIKDWLAISTWAEHKVAHMTHEVVKEATPERGSYDGVKDVAAKKS